MNLLDDVEVLAGKNPQKKADEKTPKILLIVEDEKPLASLLEDRFTSEGFSVFSAANGQEGLEVAAKHHPDVILLDLMMPVMDGKSMLHKLRDMPEFKKVPVIVLTNAGEVENITVTQRYYDAVEFLIKSNVTLDQIVEKVKSFAW